MLPCSTPRFLAVLVHTAYIAMRLERHRQHPPEVPRPYAPPRPKVTVHCKHRRKIRAPIAAVPPSLVAAQQRRGSAATADIFGICTAAAAGAADETVTGTQLFSSRRTTGVGVVGVAAALLMAMQEAGVLVVEVAFPPRWRRQGGRSRRGNDNDPRDR